MNKNFIIVLLIVGFAAVIIAGASIFFQSKSLPEQAGKLDDFAKCLADKGAIMYGADWCPHCQNEKKAFGQSFKFIPYVECPNDPNRCLSANIKGYPTWVFPDGRRFEGEQGIGKLSKESGCVLPE